MTPSSRAEVIRTTGHSTGGRAVSQSGVVNWPTFEAIKLQDRGGFLAQHSAPDGHAALFEIRTLGLRKNRAFLEAQCRRIIAIGAADQTRDTRSQHGTQAHGADRRELTIS